MIDINIENAFYSKKVTNDLAHDDRCLEDVRICMDTGSCMVVIGESGSGKSTLLKIICGLHKGFTGEISIDGSPISGKSVYYMPQKSALLPWMTVSQNIISLKKVKDSKIDIQKLDDLLMLLSIDKLKNRYPSKISGGEAQRASLASALFFEPDILLMDEPFSALDEVTRTEIQEVFNNVRRMFSISTVFVTHSIDEALTLGDHVTVLKKPPNSVSLTIKNTFKRDTSEYYGQIKRLREVISNEKR